MAISQRKSGEEFLMAFHRRFTFRLAKFLIRYDSITPNFLTSMSFVTTLISAFFFAVGQYWLSVGGAIILLIATSIDFLDGDVARLRGLSSKYGAWYDGLTDRIGFFFIIVAIVFALPYQTLNFDFIIFNVTVSKWVVGLSCFAVYMFHEYASALSGAVWTKEEIKSNAETPESQKSGIMYNIRRHLICLGIKDRYIIAICSILNLMTMSIILITILYLGLFFIVFLKKSIVDRGEENQQKSPDIGVSKDHSKISFIQSMTISLFLLFALVAVLFYSILFVYLMIVILVVLGVITLVKKSDSMD